MTRSMKLSISIEPNATPDPNRAISTQFVARILINKKAVWSRHAATRADAKRYVVVALERGVEFEKGENS